MAASAIWRARDDVVWSSANFGRAAGELATGLEAFGDGLVGCLAIEHALAAGVLGGVETAQ